MNTNKIPHFIEVHNLIAPGATIIVGLSGGPDSVFLTHFLADWHHQGIIKLIAAHLDHGWREESHNDMLFCESLCAQLAIPFVHAHASEFNILHKGSKEEIGRALRRSFFEQVAREHSAQAIALAHHKDDQLETFFLRLIRGSSIAGLTGMKPKQGLYIRPLLEITKSEIVDYLEAHQHAYTKDQTNDTLDFLRNRIRHIVIPAFKAADNRSEHTLMHTITSLQETEDFLATHTQHIWNTLSQTEQGKLVIKLSLFKDLHAALQKRVILHWLCTERVKFLPTAAFLQEIIRFLCHNRGGHHTIHAQWTIIKKGAIAYIIQKA